MSLSMVWRARMLKAIMDKIEGLQELPVGLFDVQPSWYAKVCCSIKMIVPCFVPFAFGPGLRCLMASCQQLSDRQAISCLITSSFLRCDPSS